MVPLPVGLFLSLRLLVPPPVFTVVAFNQEETLADRAGKRGSMSGYVFPAVVFQAWPWCLTHLPPLLAVLIPVTLLPP